MPGYGITARHSSGYFQGNKVKYDIDVAFNGQGDLRNAAKMLRKPSVIGRNDVPRISDIFVPALNMAIFNRNDFMSILSQMSMSGSTLKS